MIQVVFLKILNADLPAQNHANEGFTKEGSPNQSFLKGLHRVQEGIPVTDVPKMGHYEALSILVDALDRIRQMDICCDQIVVT